MGKNIRFSIWLNPISALMWKIFIWNFFWEFFFDLHQNKTLKILKASIISEWNTIFDEWIEFYEISEYYKKIKSIISTLMIIVGVCINYLEQKD